jgi:hypothetical protein
MDSFLAGLGKPLEIVWNIMPAKPNEVTPDPKVRYQSEMHGFDRCLLNGPARKYSWQPMWSEDAEA